MCDTCSHDVAAGVHYAEVSIPTRYYTPVRVCWATGTKNGQLHIDVDDKGLERAAAGAVTSAGNVKARRGDTPISSVTFANVVVANPFETRAQFSVMPYLSNPMVIMVIVFSGLMFLMSRLSGAHGPVAFLADVATGTEEMKQAQAQLADLTKGR